MSNSKINKKINRGVNSYDYLQESIIKPEKISVVDNSLKFTWLISVLIITNFALIVSKINKYGNLLNSYVLLFLFLAFLLFVLIYNFINWKMTNILFDKDKIIVYRSLILVELSEFFISNITGFVVEQNIIEKIFNVCRLKIYTEKFENNKEDLNIVLKKEEVKKLKSYILSKKLKCYENIENMDDYSIFSLKINSSNIFIHSLLNISIGNIIVISNIFYIILGMVVKGTILNEILHNLIGFLITIFTIALPVLYSMISSYIKYSDYRLKKVDGAILIKYGKITTKSYVIFDEYINAFERNETLISKIFKFNTIKILCSGSLSKKDELNFLIPMVSKKETPKILKIIFKNNELTNILDEKNPKRKDIKHSSKFALVSYFLTAVIVNMILDTILIYLRVSPYIIYMNIIIGLVLPILLYNYVKILIKDKMIMITSGIFITKKVVILTKKIVYIEKFTTPINSLFNIYMIKIYISTNNKRKISTGFLSRTNVAKITNVMLKLS